MAMRMKLFFVNLLLDLVKTTVKLLAHYSATQMDIIHTTFSSFAEDNEQHSGEQHSQKSAGR